MMTVLLIASSVLPAHAGGAASPEARALRYTPRSPSATRAWQATCRRKLFELMMGGKQPDRCPLNAQVIQRVDVPGAPYTLEEVTIQSLPDRRAHLWVATPRLRSGRRPAVLAIHGHGGTGAQIVRGESLYWYGKALAEMGYVVIAPDVGSHDLQHRNWCLMGERVWDCIRALDYAETRPDVDPRRMAVCGLSLGGETTMYVAAMDLRLRAVCSSGWLTTVANMRNGHCPCYDFPGLAEHFDFADIFGCIAPRPLVCEIGQKETAPGGFPVSIAEPAFQEVRAVYRAFGAEDQAHLTIHPGGHVFVGYDFWPVLKKAIGTPEPYARARSAAEECRQRGQMYDRAMAAAVGVLKGWWAIRDPRLGLLPRTVKEPVWAPNDNAADLMPFLFLTEHYTAAGFDSELRKLLADEQRLTNRVGVLPDWFSFERQTWVYPDADMRRLIFGAAEYCKDGLMPMTEAMGRGPWTDRMLELLDAILQSAPVATDYGRLPADDTEVNGDLLQTLGRVYAMTGQQRYLDGLLTIADAYCFEVIPSNGGIPAHRWDFARHAPIADTFNLNDHGNEIVLGLAEAYIAARRLRPERAARYEPSLDLMFTRLLKECRNPDGLWLNVVQASTARPVNRSTPDTWGYALCGVLAYAEAAGRPEMRDAVEKALKALDKPVYLSWNGADSYADAIEGAILLRNHIPSPTLDRWICDILPLFFAYQQETGIVEGWYGDGNFARTALMAALYASQGAYCRPWIVGLECGAVPTKDGLRVRLACERDWQGKLMFDSPRHRQAIRLESDYPRLNKWPEWFTVEPEGTYRLRISGQPARQVRGDELAAGIAIAVHAHEPLLIQVERLPLGHVKEQSRSRGVQ